MFKKLLLASLIIFSANTQAALTCFKDLNEDVDYTKVTPAKNHAITNLDKSMKNKNQIIEFFWYGCSHCYDAEPFITQYVKKNNSKVSFTRYPVSFPGWESGTKFYFTLEEMGIAEEMHLKTFTEIHKNRKKILDSPIERKEFLTREKVDVKKFESIFNSFSMNVKIQKSKEVIKSYGLSSTPTFVVNNKYATGPGMTNSHQKTIDVIDSMVNINDKNNKSCK